MRRFAAYWDGERGILILAALPAVVASVLPDAISRFLDRHSDIQVKVMDGTSSEVIKHVLAGRADVALTEAAEVVAEQGVDASLRDIARRANVGLATLFRHFPTRESLLEALLRTGFNELEARAAELELSSSPADARLGSRTRRVFRHCGSCSFSTIAITLCGCDVCSATMPTIRSSIDGHARFGCSVKALITPCMAVQSSIPACRR
jgi:DNA-binding transcriptional LysR family regulator